MSILVNQNTRLLVQGITGQEGLFHTEKMVVYGTKVVAGVTPGKGGEWVLNGKIPVFDSVKIAREATGANTSVIFVPARFAADAIFEAADARSRIDHLHHGRCSSFGYDAGPNLSGSKGCPPGRAQLPRAADPRRNKSGHHTGKYRHSRKDRCSFPFRHPDLRGPLCPKESGAGRINLCWHRW